MKKSKFLVWALAGASLALGACSSDDVVEGVGNVGVAPGQQGYMSLNINLPQQPRAARANDKFDDGVQAEYEVKDATLLLFAGKDEASATFQSAYDLIVGFVGHNDDPNQITSTATLTHKVTKPVGDNIYALVVLNDNGLITVNNKSATLNGKDLTNATISTLQESVLAASDNFTFNGNGFFMTNAPLFTVPGGSGLNTAPQGKVQVLAKVDPSKIFTTETEAGNAPAATIYVERAMAKVSVEENANGSFNQSENPNVASYKVSGWTLDNTNTKSYVVRNANVYGQENWWGLKSAKVDDYRFVGSNVVKPNAGLYRTYFAQDPNYAAVPTKGDLSSLKNEVPTSLLTLDQPGYCLENTFDLANQKNESSTRVIVAAALTLKDGSQPADFFTLYGNTNKLYKSFDDVKKEVKAKALLWIDQHKKEWLQGTYTMNENNVTVTIPLDKGGYIPVTEVSITLPEGATMVTGKDLPTFNSAVLAYLNTEFPVNNKDKKGIGYYKGGVSYYPVYIKHFGDDQTPWSETDAQSLEGSYGTNNANWLGRYGVLRNNWYKITVNSIKNIGEPSVPEVTDKYNDPKDTYMSVEINVLSWAVRNQSVDL